MDFTDTGAVEIDSGNLEFFGHNDSFAGSISGAGRLFFFGGTNALNSGASVTVASWGTDGGAVVNVNENLTYAGSFSEGAVPSTLSIATGDTLSLTGSAFLDGFVDGAGTVKLSNATIGVWIRGTATLSDVGTVTQTGDVVVGDASSSAATLSIVAGATYSLDNNSGIFRGSSAASIIKNSGLFIKSGGTGTNKIEVKISDAGTIEVAQGTLDFTQAMTGAGTMKIDAGAKLEADQAVASTLTARFFGGSGILVLAQPASFAATIHGFDSTDIIDLLNTAATKATLGAGDTLVIKNGAATVATLQLGGDYTAATFNVASDGHGGTNVTVTSGPTHAPQFISSMAGFGGDSHGPVSAFSEAHYAHPPMLSVPRMAMA